MQSLQATDVQHTINKYLGLLPSTSGTEFYCPGFYFGDIQHHLKKKKKNPKLHFTSSLENLTEFQFIRLGSTLTSFMSLFFISDK